MWYYPSNMSFFFFIKIFFFNLSHIDKKLRKKITILEFKLRYITKSYHLFWKHIILHIFVKLCDNLKKTMTKYFSCYDWYSMNQKYIVIVFLFLLLHILLQFFFFLIHIWSLIFLVMKQYILLLLRFSSL